MKTVWLRDEYKGRQMAVVAPNAWQGQAACVVGPFASRNLAERFAGSGVDFGHHNLNEHVFAHWDAWYVEVKLAV